jgi:flagellar hook-associated protein 2
MADPITTIPGVSSGIDWSSVVDQIIAADKQPATRMQSTIDANGKKKDAYELLRQSMTALETAADGLRTGTALDAYTVSATGQDGSGRSVLAATVGSGAVTGTTSVEVTSLAAAQKTIAATGWNATKTLSADATLTIAGKPVDLKQGDTLAAIRDKINAQSASTGVQASILSMDAAGNDQRLVLTGTKTGAANAFAVADSTNGALVAELGFDGTNTVDASDASFLLDGATTPVTRPTNVVTDAIPGVTLTLSALGTSTVTVDRQANAGASAVQAFVDAYNRLQSFIKTQSASGAPLQNDPMVRSLKGSLGPMTLTAAALVDGTGQATGVKSDLASLGTLGVSVQKDGTLAFDQTAFNAVYPSRMADVQAVLADRMSSFFSLADDYVGTYTGRIDQRESDMTSQNASLQSRIDELNSRLDKKRTALLAKYAKFEASLGKMKAIGDSMSAQFTSLLSSNSGSGN